MTSIAEPVATESSVRPPEAAGGWQRLAGLRVPSALGVLLIAALWMIARPYRGVRHDGVLYLGQTLARLMPDSIAHDLFLAYGSQDRYSIFSLLMAPIVKQLGVPLSQSGILFVCQAAFVLGSWLLTAELPSRFMRWCAMLSLVSLPHTYGGQGAVSFAEPFLTARVMAEPLLLMGLACLLRGRMAAAAGAMLLGIAVHPLIALPALASAWIYLCLLDRRWCWGALPVVAGAIAGAAGIAPFDALWRRYDPQWLASVQFANALVFMANSDLLDWTPTVFDAGVLCLVASTLAGSATARLIKAVLACALAFTILWGVGADLLHDVLLTELQLWRVFWLTHLLAVLLLPVLLFDFWARGPVGRWCAAAFVLAAVAVGANLPTGWLCVAWAALSWVFVRSSAPVTPALVRLATGVSLLAAFVATGILGWRTYQAVTNFSDRFNGASVVQIAMGLSLFTAIIGYVVLRGLGTGGRNRLLAAAAAAGLLACGWSWWDQRSDWQRFVENGLQEQGLPFEGMIPQGATVYWDMSLLEPWMLLHRPQFYALEQGGGVLFNRRNAVEFDARRKAVSPLEVQRSICQTVARLTGADLGDPNTCAPPAEILGEVCHTAGHPDYLVMRMTEDAAVPGAIATWSFRPADRKQSRSYRLYDCARQH